MHDTIAWSFSLLEQRERDLFRRLAVCTGGFSIDAATTLGALDELEALDSVGVLVADSLVRYMGDHDGAPRYDMYEAIREYGLEQLAAQGVLLLGTIHAHHGGSAVALDQYDVSHVAHPRQA